MVYADHNDHDQHLQGDNGQIARDDVDVQLMIVLTLMMMIDLRMMLIILYKPWKHITISRRIILGRISQG